MFRVVSGVMKADSTVLNKTKDAPERLGHLMLMQGKTPPNVPEIKAGDLGAVAKLKDTLTNDVLGDKSDRDHLSADRSFPSRCSPTHRAENPRRRRQDQHLDAPP
jgi:translation elongation factor EF-G